MIFTKAQEQELINRIIKLIQRNQEEQLEEFARKISSIEETQTNLIEDTEGNSVAITRIIEQEETIRVNFESTLDSIIKRLDETLSTSNIIQARLSEIEHALNIRNSAKNSKSPWAEIVATDYDQRTGQLRTTVDWNDAFIQSLISYGFRGKDDNEIISQWLTSLYHNFSGNKQQ